MDSKNRKAYENWKLNVNREVIEELAHEVAADILTYMNLNSLDVDEPNSILGKMYYQAVKIANHIYSPDTDRETLAGYQGHLLLTRDLFKEQEKVAS